MLKSKKNEENRIEIEKFLILLTIYQLLNFACQNIIHKMKLSRNFLLFYFIQIIEKKEYKYHANINDNKAIYI